MNEIDYTIGYSMCPFRRFLEDFFLENLMLTNFKDTDLKVWILKFS